MKDSLNMPIEVGDWIAYSVRSNSDLYTVVAIVKQVLEKSIKVTAYRHTSWVGDRHVYDTTIRSMRTVVHVDSKRIPADVYLRLLKV